MTRREAERQTHQADTLRALGFTREEIDQLRRISMTLQRWFEHECNGDIQRDETTDKPFWHYGQGAGKYPVADREAGARKRLAVIIAHRNGREVCEDGGGCPRPDLHTQKAVTAYIQTDPRGAALYIIRPGDVPEGQDVGSYYTRGICVY